MGSELKFGAVAKPITGSGAVTLASTGGVVTASGSASALPIVAAFDDLPASSFVKRPVVMALLGGICDEEVDRLEKRGKLPRRIKLGSRVNGWQVGALRTALAALAEG